MHVKICVSIKTGSIRFYILLLCFILSVNKGICQSIEQSATIYKNTILSEKGTQHALQNFQGKKLLLVILPATQTTSDIAFMSTIDSLAIVFKEKVQIIGIPSYEDGYVKDSTNMLMLWYHQSLGNGEIVSKPLNTHITSGQTKQDKLFYWLTHSASNEHFDNEVSGPGTIFLINGQGKLTGVLGGKYWNVNMLKNILLQAN